MSQEMYTRELTIEDILSHRSGFPPHDEALMGHLASIPDTPKSVTRKLRHLPINKSIRTTYQYSNIMYTVASYLVEVLSGIPFDSFLETRLWAPLGMENTFLQLKGVEQHDARATLSKPYRWDDKNGEHVQLPWWRQHEGQGAGSIFSCVSDFAKWIRCMMHQSPPISLASHKELTKPRIISDPDREAQKDDEKLFSHTLYALGWEVRTYRSHTLIGHDGSVAGYESKMCYLPHWNWGIVIFGNSTGTDDGAEIILYTLIDELLCIPEEDRLNWTQVIQRRRSEREDDSDDDPWIVDAENCIQLPLALLNFAGTYYHPGYGTIALAIEDNQLVADCWDRSYPFKLRLHHASDTRFTVEYCLPREDYSIKFKSQFNLQENGAAVSSFGIAISENMLNELIWFDKVVQEQCPP